METKTADEIINMISETLSQADDKSIQKIANLVLSEYVKYEGGKFILFDKPFPLTHK
jgi:hypothetical protein